MTGSEAHIQDETRLDWRGRVRTRGVAAGVAVLGLSLSLSEAVLADAGLHRFFSAYLVSFSFVLSLSLGALFFVLIQRVSRAGWSTTIRRMAELLAAQFPLLALLAVPVVVGLVGFDLYHWTHAHDPIIEAKRAYLNVPFFIGRLVFYFACWSGLGIWLWRGSVRQDSEGDASITTKLQAGSAPALLLFALTLTFASFDLLMSLSPHWFSTIFGVYFFAGAVIAAVAAQIIVAALFQRLGVLQTSVTTHHFHDLGKLLFGFVFFWGYIAFSQYMLIWYANIPEETAFLAERGVSTDPNTTSPFTMVSVLLVVAHFVIPFAGLLSRRVKRHKALLVGWAVWMLVVHYIDLVWIVRPALLLPVTWGDVTAWLGTLVFCVGAYVAMAITVMGERHLVAVKDPRVSEALNFEQPV